MALQNLNNMQPKTKTIKTRFLIALILQLSIISMKAGADTNKAISGRDTTLIIINKKAVDNNLSYINSNSKKEHIFAVMPDTTIKIIIIYRRIYACVSENNTQNK
jgi:hypothetical protein